MRATEAHTAATAISGIDRLVVHLLLVHDGRAYALLQSRLSAAGFAVRTAPVGVSALKSLSEWNPEVILLDGLRPRDGLAAIPVFRRVTQAPIIVLGANETASEKVVALMRGADDHVTRPFDIDELIARIHSALRRPHLVMTEKLRYSDLLVDTARRLVARSNRTIHLSRREFELLLVLVRNPERVFSRADLLDSVWGADSDVTPAILDTYISYLRTKIDSGHDRKLIHTIRGVGYALRDGA